MVIVGDSHTQTAINDGLVNNAINISHSSENFLFTYNVLDLILKNNTQINTVILGVSFHSFSKNYDKNLQNYSKSKFIVPNYLPILDGSAINNLWALDHKNLIKILPESYKILLNDLILVNSEDLSNYSFIGGYYEGSGNNLGDSIIAATIKKHYSSTSQEFLSKNQVKWFDKILDLTSRKHINLIVVNTPINQKYKNRIPKKMEVEYYKILEKRKNGFIYRDFSDLELPDSCFGDGDHLNKDGAEIFTKLFFESFE